MRRRILVVRRQPPDRLVRFDPADWPDRRDDPYNQAAYGLWTQARAQFDRLYGWPSGTVQRIQDQVAESTRHISTVVSAASVTPLGPKT